MWNHLVIGRKAVRETKRQGKINHQKDLYCQGEIVE
jgi:hypothetical protein